MNGIVTIRFAINLGEVRVERGDVFGEAVNIAARIEGLAEGGEIWFSESVYLTMNKSEVPFEEVGKRQLKGIEEPVGVYRIPKLAEVGSYKLAPKAGLAGKDATGRPADPRALPYGGMALARLRGQKGPGSAQRPGRQQVPLALGKGVARRSARRHAV